MPEISSVNANVLVHEFAVSFDHLVDAGEQRWWNSEAERFGRFQIDDQLIFCRRLYRQVCRLLALEDAIDVAGGAPELVKDIWTVGDQADMCNPGTGRVDRRQ